MDKNNILVVGRAKELLSEVEFRLLSEGFSVTTADTSAKALDVMYESAPDMVISDVSMADMDGFDLCRKVRQESLWMNIPFIFISSKGSIDDKLMGFELGCDDYLSRPFEMDELLARINIKLGYASRLAKGSNIDPSTGLLTKTGFESRLANEVDRCVRYKRRFSIAKLNADSLQEIKDNHGQKAYDNALKDFAEFLLANIRKVDILARFSGNQFVVIMPEIDKNHSMVPLERIRQGLLNSPVTKLNGNDIHMEAYGGVAEFPVDGSSADDILSATDSALVASQAAGKNRVTMFQKG